MCKASLVDKTIYHLLVDDLSRNFTIGDDLKIEITVEDGKTGHFVKEKPVENLAKGIEDCTQGDQYSANSGFLFVGHGTVVSFKQIFPHERIF